jgi:hypothetical protein
MSSFEQSRTCSKCENEETRQLEKIDAAFVQHSRWDAPCGNCGAQDFSTQSMPMPNLDKDILEAWIKDENLNLLDQDEDIILASKENLELLKAYVVRDDAKLEKRSMLLSALCVLIYDSNEEDDAQTLEDSITFLTNNRHLFDEIGDEAIFDYVKDVAYPKIGLTPPSAQ